MVWYYISFVSAFIISISVGKSYPLIFYIIDFIVESSFYRCNRAEKENTF